MRLPAHVLALALGCALLAGGARAELWQWTDADGVVRYTPDAGRVPASARGSLLRVEPGMSQPEPPPPTQPGPPPLVSAPPDELRFEADPFNAPEPAPRIEVSDVPEPAAPLPSAPAAGRAAAPASATAATAATAAATPPAPPAPRPGPPEAAPPATASARASAPQPVAPEPAPPPPPLSPEQRSRRAELETLIARDEERLKDLVSQDAPDLEDSEELRAVARRLPALQAELRALEERVAQEATGPMAEP